MRFLTFKMEERIKLGIKLKIYCCNTMLNYQFTQILKLLGNGIFNHLVNHIILKLSLTCKLKPPHSLALIPY